ncbi:hypothetical protein AMS68_002257 [Peltaster fructicola]|uniref:Alpha/beta hydrolase fold-3 domain-containing protein n=1 Tax=Peltaster fructicola TaxID=286661 RepID=A0A6H0XQI8_9PEZI|nr:hypothetical protein AMS68_002257 [Peltaster fructicola]
MQVTAADVVKSVFVAVWLPFALVLGIAERLFTGRKDVVSLVPLSIKRAAVSRLNVESILSSPRFRSVGHELCEKVERKGLLGYWISQGSLSSRTTPSECDAVLLYIHGGAYVLGHPLMNVVQLLRISELMSSKGLSISTFSLSYDLAPESTFPRPFEQALAAYRYLLEEAHIKPEKIVICGESAGGHLALTLLHKLADQQIPKPGGAALLFPWVDLSNSGDSFNRNRKNDVLQRHELDRAVHWTCGDDGRKTFADIFDYSTPKSKSYWRGVLPAKTWVGVGSHDLFYDSIEDFVEYAREDGCVVEYDIFEGKTHGYPVMLDVLSRKRYLQLSPEQDVGALMQGAGMIAKVLLNLLED